MLIRASVGMQAIIAALALHSGSASAQQAHKLALSAGLGWGMGSGGDYVSPQTDGALVSIALRRPTPLERVSYVAQMEADGLALGRKIGLLCTSRDGRTCIPHYPDFISLSASAGLMLSPQSWIELRTAVGPGVYRADGSTALGATAAIDAAIFPLRHLGIVGGRKVVIVPSFNAQRLRIAGAFIALRWRS